MTEDTSAQIRLLQEALAQAKSEAEAAENEAARARADFANLRRRHERDMAAMRSGAGENAVRSLLPVLDNLDRALGANGDAESLVKGVQMVRRQFASVLEELGAQPVEAAGAFDPSCHEAVDQVPVNDPELDGKVIEEYRRGYAVGGRVVRPAQVRVGVYVSAKNADATE